MKSGLEGSKPAVRLARQDELAAVDALLGARDWTRRDAVGLLAMDGSRRALCGAAVLTAHQATPSTSVLRMVSRIVDDGDTGCSFAALVDFALAASTRSAVSRLIVEQVADDVQSATILQRRGFRLLATTLHFEGQVATARRLTADLAKRATRALPQITILPLASCSPAELIALAATGIGVLGLGVRALQAGDKEMLSSFAGSYGAQIDGRLRAAIIATTVREPAFIEMLVVERRYSHVAAVLIERCAEALLECGALTFAFSTSLANRRMRQLAGELQCWPTRRFETWEAPVPARGPFVAPECAVDV